MREFWYRVTKVIHKFTHGHKVGHYYISLSNIEYEKRVIKSGMIKLWGFSSAFLEVYILGKILPGIRFPFP